LELAVMLAGLSRHGKAGQPDNVYRGIKVDTDSCGALDIGFQPLGSVEATTSYATFCDPFLPQPAYIRRQLQTSPAVSHGNRAHHPADGLTS